MDAIGSSAFVHLGTHRGLWNYCSLNSSTIRELRTGKYKDPDSVGENLEDNLLMTEAFMLRCRQKDLDCVWNRLWNELDDHEQVKDGRACNAYLVPALGGVQNSAGGAEFWSQDCFL